MGIDSDVVKQRVVRVVSVILEYAGINYRISSTIKRYFKTFFFTKKRQFEFITDFASWLNDGCSPAVACKSIIDAGAKDRNFKLEVDVATSIYESLAAGRPISEGMVEWFSPEVVTLFDAGQEAGVESLIKVVNEYLMQAENISLARKEFLKPIFQPFIYSMMTFGGMVAMGGMVLPEFSEILPIEKMGFAAVYVHSIGKSIVTWLPFLLVLLFFFTISSYYFLRNNTSRFRLFMDSYFPLNIYKSFVAMKFLKTLGILVETRYNLHRAALELKRTSGQYIIYHLNHIIKETQFGETNLATSLDSGLLSKRLMFRLRNAAASPDEGTRKRAISVAADRSGDEAIRSLVGTRRYCALALWLVVIMNLLMLAGSFLGIFSSLTSMSYR